MSASPRRINMTGEVIAMFSIVKKSAVLAAMFVLLGSASARAGTIEVKVPFPFVVNGQTLPAGEYILEREGLDVLYIRGEKTAPGVPGMRGVFVQTEPASGSDPAGETPTLTFAPHEKEHRLVGIWESRDHGFTILGS
jgi:hypothetical protein